MKWMKANNVFKIISLSIFPMSCREQREKLKKKNKNAS